MVASPALVFCRAQQDGGKGKMLYDTRRFVFTVSLCAMLAVNPVLATAPGEEDVVSTVHDVYTESTNTGTEGAPLNLSSGIASVTYVNRMVNSAGNAAQRAEDHAAAAGASAIAAQSAADDAQTAADDAQSAADAATETLKSKLDKSQGTDNKDKVMVVGSDGNLTPGMVGASAIADNAIGSTNIVAGGVHTHNIATGAVTAGSIAYGAVTVGKINADKGYAPYSGVLGYYSGSGMNAPSGMYWSQVHSDMIADGAVTMGKIYADRKWSDANYNGVLAFHSGEYQGVTGMYWTQVYSGMIADGAVTIDKINADKGYSYGVLTGVLAFYSGSEYGGPSGMYWSQVHSNMIADGAVTPAQTAGVVGTIPWGSADSTTYGQFWIE